MGASGMKKHRAKLERLEGLREMLSAYRRMTIEEAEATSWGARMYDRYGEDMTEAEFTHAVTEMIDEMGTEKVNAPDCTPDIDLKYSNQ